MNQQALRTTLATDDQLAQETEEQCKPKALTDGGSLRTYPGDPTTLPQVLERSAEQIVGESIVYLQGDGSEIVQSYAELLEEAQKILGGLRKQGLIPQDKVILQLEKSWDIIPAFWGCILGGFVPTIMEAPITYVESNPIAKKVRQIWEFLDKPFIITNKELPEKIQSFLSGSEQKISSIETLRQNAPDKSYYPSKPEETAFFNLTSGSTGMPKCVRLTHRNLISRSRGANILNHHQPEDVILNWLPFDHIGSISDWHIRCIELGCKQVYAPKEYILGRALNWLDLIDKYRVNSSWAPNFAYSLVNDLLERQPNQTWDLSCVEFLLTAGEAVSSQAVEEFMEKMAAYGLSKTALRPAFGMAELGSGITYYQPTAEAPLKFHRVDKDSLGGTIKRVGAEHPNSSIFADLGPVIPGVTIRIVDEENSILPEDTIGHLQVSGDVVSPGYDKNPEANQASFLENGWFDTGDLGFITNGHLVLTGRAKETIIINGANYYSQEIETIVEEIEGVEVSYTAACAVRDPNVATEKLAIFFHATTQKNEELLGLLQTIRKQVITKIGVNPDYLIPVPREVIPKTAIGKIQRLQLSKSFETGKFKAIVQQLDMLLGNKNTIPDWFYRKIWRPKELSGKEQQKSQGVTLVFLDRLGLGSYLYETLPEDCIAVEMGSEYIWGEKVCHIDPTNPEHYMQLVKSAGEISQILHLWTYDKEEVEIPNPEALELAQQRGIYSLLFLVQALAQMRKPRQEMRLLWISSQCQATHPGAEIAPAKSTVLGLLKTIPQELPWLSTCHIDLLTDEVETNAQYILKELKALSKELEVAYRDKQRLVCRLEKVDWQQEERQELPFKQGGIYLLSGGMGGIGCEIAKYLLENYQAKLLLVGRSPLEEKSSVYRQLEQLDGEIIYETADICNLKQLQQVVTKALSQWGGELDGVIHLAGVYRESLVLDSSVKDIADVLRAKVLGSWILHQLLKDNPNATFIHFSSIAAFFGGITIGAYSAANCFLESFAHYQRQKSKLSSYCLAWSSWREIGISQGNKMEDLLRAKGYAAISSEQGILSLLTGLYHGQGQLFVGLDGSNRNIQSYLEIEEGEIDQKQLLQNSNGKATGKKIAPRNKLERQLVAMWQEVLEIGNVGIDDNFFALGGNSIKAMVLVNRLEEKLNQILHPVALFDAPTIAKFADYIQENYPELVEKGESKVAERWKEEYKVDFLSEQTGKIAESLGYDRPFGNALPLTVEQELVWWSSNIMGFCSNTWRIWRIEGDLNLQVLQEAIKAIARRHAPLHTTLKEVEGNLVQVVHSEVEPVFEVLDYRDLAKKDESQALWNDLEEFALSQFDLINGSMVKIKILRLGETSYIFMACIDHIAIDAWSWGIFIHELNALYSAFASGQPSPLQPLSVTFTDFARWQHQYLQEGVLAKNLNYWRKNLAGKQFWDLPGDRPTPANPTFHAETEPSKIDSELKRGLEHASKKAGVSVYVTLLSAYSIVLASLARQEDAIVNTVFVNRSGMEGQPLIGTFVNRLPMHLNLKGNPTFTELLHRLHQTFRDTYTYSSASFPQLLEIWKARGNPFQFPIPAGFNLIDITNSEDLELPDMKTSFIRMGIFVTWFKLELHVLAIDEGYLANFMYMSEVFDRKTIAGIARKFHWLLETVVTDSQKNIADLFAMLDRVE